VAGGGVGVFRLAGDEEDPGRLPRQRTASMRCREVREGERGQ
jgi:hypothetical protein